MSGIVLENNSTTLRFGGISPIVLRELSGVYQPFVKAVKEIISNAYDADANKVHLNFRDSFNELSIEDDGCGMDPLEFVRDYIRIGKSYRQDEYTSIKKRPRIGGKGIGFLAPARYCQEMDIVTKKGFVSQKKLGVNNIRDNMIDIGPILLGGIEHDILLQFVRITAIVDENEQEVPFVCNGTEITLLRHVDSFTVNYELDTTSLELRATINFEALFSIDSNTSLEQINNFCTITITQVAPSLIPRSYTRITLKNIKDFVKLDLNNLGKKRARNIGSYNGFDQFLWNLSRIIPIKANIHDNLPIELQEFIRSKIDGEAQNYPIDITYSVENEVPVPLLREVIQPERPLTLEADGDILKILDYDIDGFQAFGYLIGQSSTIFPAECRGILIRVKGVAIGEPTFFGLDQLLTGSSKVALSQISGEINIIQGIDAINDINPGRDGFYKESKQYNKLKHLLIGDNPEKMAGPLKDVIDGIIIRSEMNASMANFIKKYEAQRKAILEASAIIAELSIEAPFIIDQFFVEKPQYELQLSNAVPFKAEGKLATYTVSIEDGIGGNYQIDYVEKKLLLSSTSDIWKKNIRIGDTDFEIIQKQGKQKKLFCEVNPKTKKIYVNWDHPMRTTMGDGNYIKHCLATVASALPQEQLNTYIQLVTSRV